VAADSGFGQFSRDHLDVPAEESGAVRVSRDLRCVAVNDQPGDRSGYPLLARALGRYVPTAEELRPGRQYLEGARHDVFCLDESGALAMLNPRDWTGDKGYIGRDMVTPIKKTSKKVKLLDWQKTFNTAINKIRAVIERIIANLKTWRILHTDYRRAHSTLSKTTISAVIGLQFYSLA
jgi:hypothetical protein